jgi:hypothetical protein
MAGAGGGMFCRMSATDLKPCFSISARLMVSTGWAVSVSTWRMREPVTSMRSRLVALAWAVAVLAPATSAITTASRSWLDLSFIGSLSPRNLGWVNARRGSERALPNREADPIVAGARQELKLC